MPDVVERILFACADFFFSNYTSQHFVSLETTDYGVFNSVYILCTVSLICAFIFTNSLLLPFFLVWGWGCLDLCVFSFPIFLVS